MASSDIKAGRAYVEIAAKNNLSKELDKIGKQLANFGAALTGIGTKMLGVGIAIVTPLALASAAFAKMGSDIQHASERTGIAVETLSALSYAASQSGASLDDVVSALTKMEKNIFVAANGSAELTKALAAVNTTVAQLKEMSPDQRFLTMASALGKITEESTKTGLTLQIFGKSAAALLPLFNNGADGIQKLIAKANELGIVISGKDAKAAKDFENTLNDLSLQFKTIVFQIGAAVASVLQPFASSTEHVVKSIIDWTKAHKPLIVGLLTFGAAIAAGGAALVAMGITLTATGAVLSSITTVLGVVGSAIAFLVNPISLTIAAIAALGVAAAYYSGYVSDVFAFLRGQFQTLADTANETVSGIADALAAGDIQLAAQILWTGLQLAWKQGTQFLLSYWYAFKDVLTKTMVDIGFGFAEIWTIATSSVKSIWAETVNFFSLYWNAFIDTFTSGWFKAVNLVTKGLNVIHGLWDSTFDSKAANKAADNLLADKRSGLSKNETDIAVKSEDEKNQKLADIKKQRDATLAGLSERNQAIDAGADTNMSDDMQGDRDQITKLQGQMHQLRTRAAVERGLKLPDKPSQPKNDLLEGTAKASGIFNVGALASLQSSTPLNDIAKATKETAKNTRNKATFG